MLREGFLFKQNGIKETKTNKQKQIRNTKMKNPCLKTRDRSNPYEIWASSDYLWRWAVLKKYQLDDEKPHARWFCFVTSPLCVNGEYGDVYVKEIKQYATKINLI